MPSTSVDHTNVNKKVSLANAKHIDPTIGAHESREDGIYSVNM